jgi:hypothetical protein
MTKLIVELDDGTQYEAALKPLTATKSTPKSRKAAKEPDLRELCEEAAAKFDRKELRSILSEYDAKKIDDVDDSDLEDLQADLQKEKGGEPEIDAEAVKIACQAFAKKNGKKELDEILEDYEISSVRSLSKLSAEDLADLYADVTED